MINTINNIKVLYLWISILITISNTIVNSYGNEQSVDTIRCRYSGIKFTPRWENPAIKAIVSFSGYANIYLRNDSLYISNLGNVEGWIAGKIEDNKVIFNNGTGVDAIVTNYWDYDYETQSFLNSVTNSEYLYLDPVNVDYQDIDGWGFCGTQIYGLPTYEPLVFDFDKSLIRINNSNSQWWMAESPNNSIAYSITFPTHGAEPHNPGITPDEYLTISENNKKLVSAFICSPYNDENLIPATPTLNEYNFHIKLYPNTLRYITVSYNCPPVNTNGEVLDVQNLRIFYEVEYKANQHNGDNMNVSNDEKIAVKEVIPSNYSATYDGKPWLRGFSPKKYFYLDKYYSTPGYGNEFTVRCFLRYYPNGYEENPGYYYESEMSEPVYCKNNQAYAGVDPISENLNLSSSSDVMYDFTGRAVESATARPGIYIRNGKKVMVK